MKQLSFWAFAAAIILSGCASEEISDQHDLQGENGRKAITVSTYLPGHTRGYNAMQAGISDLAQGMGNGFIMSAMMGNDTIINGERYYADPETGECLTANETVYTWPDEESDLTFLAYYPASEQM